MIGYLLASGRVEIRRRERGYCVEGPGFYVWDEDPREVTRLARDLARGVRSGPTDPLVPVPAMAPTEPR
jgi:hypothetical protein